jgi:hypothetical protein
MVDLGAIEHVDLREVWPHEAQDFTPWLAENLDKLGDALGLDLELRTSEAAVGQFSLDVLAHDLGSNRPVIIENQLEATNHDHLGKLLTYAAGYDAYAVAWLTREFRDEHRQALDWLNQRTNEDTAFFGVVVEAWRIDDSRPAAHFRAVAFPNDWQKQSASVDRNDSGRPYVSERGERYREFFQNLIDLLRDQYRFTNARKGQPQSWYSFSSGFRGIGYNPSFSPRRGIARVEVYIDRGDGDLNKQLFDALATMSDAIQTDLAESLEWERLDNRRACRISAVRDGSIDDDPDSLEELQGWMVDRLLAFKQVLTPELQRLAR